MATAQTRMTRTKTIVLLGIMLALTVVFSYVNIQILGVTLALMILPTIIVAQVSDFKTSFAMAILMGLTNYLAWFTSSKAGNVIFAPIFQNPIICIVPRVLIGVVAYWSRRGLEFLILKKGMKIDINPKPVIEEEDDGVVSEDIEEVEAFTLKNDDTSDIVSENAVESVDFDTQNGDSANAVEDEPVICDVENDLEATQPEEGNKKTNRLKKAKEESARQAIYLVSTALAVLTNTVFVMIFTLMFFHGKSLGGKVVNQEFIEIYYWSNFGIEILAFSLFVPPVTLAIRAAKLV